MHIKACIIACLCAIALAHAATYKVQSKKINSQKPVISSQNADASIYTYNYNTAYLPLFGADGKVVDGLLVRCQNATTDKYSVGPSVLGLSTLDTSDLDNIKATAIDQKTTVFAPKGPSEAFGTEDPRVVYRPLDKTYYLLYSAVAANPTFSSLSLATSKQPQDASSWVRHGPVLPGAGWSKSGSMLIRDGSTGPHYLFWGDSTGGCGLSIAISSDLLTWKNIANHTFLPCRADSFDKDLVEAGPLPLRLTDGNYLFLYNSARTGYPSDKPGWDTQYNIGWAVLDQNDPTKVLQRSDEPLLSPNLGWENGTQPYLGLTPNVVFVEGWQARGANTFVAYYGGADSVVGATLISVDIQ